MATTLELDVEVTQDDIDQGVARDCYECPGARAINRALEEFLGSGRYVASVGSVVFVRSITKNEDGASTPYHAVLWAEILPMELFNLMQVVDSPTIYGPATPVSFHLSLASAVGL